MIFLTLALGCSYLSVWDLQYFSCLNSHDVCVCVCTPWDTPTVAPVARSVLSSKAWRWLPKNESLMHMGFHQGKVLNFWNQFVSKNQNTNKNINKNTSLKDTPFWGHLKHWLSILLANMCIDFTLCTSIPQAESFAEISQSMEPSIWILIWWSDAVKKKMGGDWGGDLQSATGFLGAILGWRRYFFPPRFGKMMVVSSSLRVSTLKRRDHLGTSTILLMEEILHHLGCIEFCK